jgi:hypothetical protein
MNQKSPIVVLAVTVAILTVTTIYFATTSNPPSPKTSIITKQQTQENGNIPQKPKVGPKEVTENYVKYTLGIPANYALARDYLAPELKQEFDTIPGFVPRSYGIQEVPNSTTVLLVSEDNNRAIVNAVGDYSGSNSKTAWKFVLVIIENEWKITSINKALD